MIRYDNRATIVPMGGPPGGICVRVAARGLAGPGCGGRRVAAGPVVGLRVGPAGRWPAVGEGRA
jgi:hypothetical protein